MTKTEMLLQRMLGFVEGSQFDGYPTLSCADEGLVHEAVGECGQCDRDPLQFLCYLASEHATTPETFDNARRFVADYVATMWACNMIEGSNPVYDERFDADGDYLLT